MKTIKILTYVIFALFLGLVTSSCGSDGAAGNDGTDGTNGNANVSIISLNYSDITWSVGSFLGTTTNTFALTDNRVNQDIIDHGTVLGYTKINNQWYALPFTWSNSTQSQYVFHTYALNTITLYAYRTNGVLDPSALVEYRFMLITDNTVTSSARPAKTKQKIQDELEAAGVDINDYYAVMDYYGLDTE